MKSVKQEIVISVAVLSILFAGSAIAATNVSTETTTESTNINQLSSFSSSQGGQGGHVIGPLVYSNSQDNISVGLVSPGLQHNTVTGSYTPYAATAKDANNTTSAAILSFTIPRVLGADEFANFYANLSEAQRELLQPEDAEDSALNTAPTMFSDPTEERGGSIGWYSAMEIFRGNSDILTKRGNLNIAAIDADNPMPREYSIVAAMDKARRADKDIIVVFYADSEKTVVGKDVAGWSAGIGAGSTLISGTSFFSPSIGLGYSDVEEGLSQEVLSGIQAAIYEVTDRASFDSLVKKNREAIKAKNAMIAKAKEAAMLNQPGPKESRQ